MLSITFSRCWLKLALLGAVVLLAGCFSPAAEFRRYETYAKKINNVEAEPTGLTSEQWTGLDEEMIALFGTPDAPDLPLADNILQVVDKKKLVRAAGPVRSDELGVAYGLYREHCAHCHGVTGDGNGPTAAFLNPYPRDYRLGLFKFKSTGKVDDKPTHADLKKIVVDGIPGTAMPSFKLLSDADIEALVHYVKYLAIRGEVERELITRANETLPTGRRLMNDAPVTLNTLYPDEKEAIDTKTNELVEKGKIRSEAYKTAQEEVLKDAEETAATAYSDSIELTKGAIDKVVGRWHAADSQVVEIPPRPAMTEEELIASRKRGRDLFYGTIANCVKCHGDSALGDGTTNDYDQWTKDLVDPTKVADDEAAKEIAKFVALGMPEPRNIRPRNLRQGVYRGGSRPIDIYWRIKNGISGTPMPAATFKEDPNSPAKGLTSDDIWDIVNYVQHLPYEPLSQPPEAVALERPRN